MANQRDQVKRRRANRRNEDQWHLDKRIPISLILTLIIQTGAALWWASAMDQRVNELEKDGLVRANMPDRLTRLEVIAEQLPNMFDRIDRKLDRIDTETRVKK